MSWNRAVVVAGGVLAVCGSARAVVNPFTETFSSPAASWSTSSVFTALNYPGTGGPDGSGYGSASITFATNVNGDQPILFRGQSNFPGPSSGGAFFGDWLGAGVSQFSFSVRQSTSVPVTFFARFSNGGAGVVAVASPPVQPNTWTTFTVPINPGTPFIYEGAPSLYGQTFGAVARVQIGVLVDGALAGQAGPFAFDVDNVGIVPAPGAATMLLGAIGMAGIRRRRK